MKKALSNDEIAKMIKDNGSDLSSETIKDILEQCEAIIRQHKQNIIAGIPSGNEIKKIMKEIKRLMTHEKFYKKPSLTVDLLAQKLGIKPYIVSIAINKSAHKNFNTLINEYRIKEAIHLLKKKKCTIDHILSNCGFSDRKSFNRTFKKATGVSPTEFRNNLS